jgi:hypothetical protein
MLGFASTVMCSWEVLLVLFKLSLYTGGFPNLVSRSRRIIPSWSLEAYDYQFWGFIVNVCGMLFVYVSALPERQLEAEPS